MEYHGKEVIKIEADQFCFLPGVLIDYVMETLVPLLSTLQELTTWFIDASNEN